MGYVHAMLRDGESHIKMGSPRAYVDAALAGGAKDKPDWGSIAHRVRGESYELLGKIPEALSAYEQALSLNPKIGVQKRVTNLRKTLSTG